jgi:hypothetical protein
MELRSTPVSYPEIGRLIGRKELWSQILRHRSNDPTLSPLELLTLRLHHKGDARTISLATADLD